MIDHKNDCKIMLHIEDTEPYIAANGNRFSAEQAKLITERLLYRPRDLGVHGCTCLPMCRNCGKPVRTWEGQLLHHGHGFRLCNPSSHGDFSVAEL